jgi:hypothetical protein
MLHTDRDLSFNYAKLRFLCVKIANLIDLNQY